MNDLRKAVMSYLDQEPDTLLRSQARDLLLKFENGDLDSDVIRERFLKSLQFGTAGLRAKMESGLNRINRVTVAKAAYAIGHNKSLCQKAVIVGYDARINSQLFAEEVSGVLRGLGLTVFEFPEPVATPICAFAIEHMKASAGIMVTASHNPPGDNGLKVFGANGAQITKKDIDVIEENLKNSPNYHDICKAEIDNDRLNLISMDSLLSRYNRKVQQTAINKDAKREKLRVVYTPLHGVGYRFLASALNYKDKIELIPVESQVKPDGKFPTLQFPNPEEAGALDLAFDEAKKVKADLVIAHDPDADRLAAAFPTTPNAKFQMLTGNEVGAILGSDILENYSSERKKLVVSTLVSSRQLSFIADACGASYAESLTGFSQIAQIATAREIEHSEKFLFGFEEALGYCVSGILKDKDGISAAVRLLDRVALLKAEGKTIWNELDRIALQYGLFRNLQWSMRIDDAKSASLIELIMSDLRGLKEHEVFFESGLIEKKYDLSSQRYNGHANANILIFYLKDETRVVVRPSGTEPKVKFYIEKMTQEVTRENLEKQREILDRDLALLKQKIEKKLRTHQCA